MRSSRACGPGRPARWRAQVVGDICDPRTSIVGGPSEVPGHGRASQLQFLVTVNTPPHESLAVKSPTGTHQETEQYPITRMRLASLVDDVIFRLEAPSGNDLAGGLIPECNAALEACLEMMRDAGDGDDRARTARDDLKRLARLLKLVDGPDVPFVLRQIRRVLGRFDACARRDPR